MSMPDWRAASQIVVPAGTRTFRPSMLSSTVVSDATLIAGSLSSKTHPRRTLVLVDMTFDLVAEMANHRGDRQGRRLSKAADRGQLHRLRELIDRVQIACGAPIMRDPLQHLHQLLRSHPAGDA